LNLFLFCLIFPYNVNITVSLMRFVIIQVEKNVILEQLETSSFPYIGINGKYLTIFVSSKQNNCQSFWPIDLILVSKCLELNSRLFWLFEFSCPDCILRAMRKKTVQIYEIVVIFLETQYSNAHFLFSLDFFSNSVCMLILLDFLYFNGSLEKCLGKKLEGKNWFFHCGHLGLHNFVAGGAGAVAFFIRFQEKFLQDA